MRRLLELRSPSRAVLNWRKLCWKKSPPAFVLSKATVWEVQPDSKPRWSFLRRGGKPEQPPRALLAEILDREAGMSCGASGKQSALVAACLSFIDRPNRVLMVARPRDSFTAQELEYTVAAGHYLGLALENARIWDEMRDKEERLEALIDIGRQMVQERETVPLLEHIAAKAAQLLRSERASIFLLDKSRKELVGRPALGLPNGELRLPEDAGVVGNVVATGEVQIVDNVKEETTWHAGKIDQASGFEDPQSALRAAARSARANANHRRAFEVMNKSEPFTPADVTTLEALAQQTVAALSNVREREALVRSNNELDGQARLGARIIGDSTAIVALRGTLERIARTDLPVLVLGESGTGKDVVARAVHYASPRQQHPFIPVNCAAIAETLLESELFGHEKGAFTDAHSTRAGKFEAASGGTLFLDEIGDLSAGGQAKLLRVLEEKVVYRVGGTQPIPVDARIVAATNRQALSKSVRAGKFLRRLVLHRLTVVTVDLPPLRERREDILILADHFLQQFSRAAGRKPLKISADARKRLEHHDWPGNVRELRNLLERVAYLCPADKVEAADLAFILRPAKGDVDRFSGLDLAAATDAFQMEHIKQAIEKTGGHMGEAAKLLGLHRPNLYRKMRMLGMDVK